MNEKQLEQDRDLPADAGAVRGPRERERVEQREREKQSARERESVRERGRARGRERERVNVFSLTHAGVLAAESAFVFLPPLQDPCTCVVSLSHTHTNPRVLSHTHTGFLSLSHAHTLAFSLTHTLVLSRQSRRSSSSPLSKTRARISPPRSTPPTLSNRTY